jgi:hypothetical protein
VFFIQWRTLFQIYLPFVFYKCFQFQYEPVEKKNEQTGEITTSTKQVRNPHEGYPIFLFGLLGRIAQGLCVRVLTEVAVAESKNLLQRYVAMFKHCFPEKVVINHHSALAHLAGF